jgi:lycopene cyclase domain-containing protein
MPGRLTYLVLELGWALPVLILQWIVGWRDLWAARRALLVSVLLPSAYLTLADGVAIHNGIWRFHDSRILGVIVADVPIEEAIFFVLTNALVVQAVILVAARLKARGVGAPLS